jgi:hypothetical protein
MLVYLIIGHDEGVAWQTSDAILRPAIQYQGISIPQVPPACDHLVRIGVKNSDTSGGQLKSAATVNNQGRLATVAPARLFTLLEGTSFTFYAYSQLTLTTLKSVMRNGTRAGRRDGEIGRRRRASLFSGGLGRAPDGRRTAPTEVPILSATSA